MTETLNNNKYFNKKIAHKSHSYKQKWDYNTTQQQSSNDLNILFFMGKSVLSPCLQISSRWHQIAQNQVQRELNWVKLSPADSSGTCQTGGISVQTWYCHHLLILHLSRELWAGSEVVETCSSPRIKITHNVRDVWEEGRLFEGEAGF